MLSGHVIIGGVLSTTVTVNEQLGPSLIEQLTVVVPLAKNDPDEGVQVTVPHGPPVVGAGYWTFAPHWVEPGPVFTVWFCGQVIVHAVAGHCRNKIDTSSTSRLATARSCLPSPLKSPTATEVQRNSAPKKAALPKLPVPSP